MRKHRHRTGWILLGGTFGAGVAAIVTSALALFAGSGAAAGQAAPRNIDPPTISGTPQVGQTLIGHRGSWSNNPTSYAFAWLRCDSTGGSCARISGADTRQYTLKSVDLGNTLRFRVTATNADGSNDATSVPTAVVASPPPPPSRGAGCPAGSGNPDQVASINAPARLLVDTLTSDPSVVTSSTTSITLRFHVTSSCGGPVQGALVYATATPYNQFAIPAEAPTDATGWATLTFSRLSGFPVSSRQQLIAIFVRARKPGENLLAGISTRRLVSIPVHL